MKPFDRKLVAVSITLTLVGGLLISCSKEELADGNRGATQEVAALGTAKALSFFIKVTNGYGTPAFGDGCNLWMNTRNGGVWFHNTSTCSQGSGSVGVGGLALQECFLQVDCTTSSQWNWLRAVAGPSNRKWLRFRFDYSFNSAGSSGNLVTYNYTTGIWTVNTSVPGFCWELRNANDPAAPTPC